MYSVFIVWLLRILLDVSIRIGTNQRTFLATTWTVIVWVVFCSFSVFRHYKSRISPRFTMMYASSIESIYLLMFRVAMRSVTMFGAKGNSRNLQSSAEILRFVVIAIMKSFRSPKAFIASTIETRVFPRRYFWSSKRVHSIVLVKCLLSFCFYYARSFFASAAWL